jgi:hypothetical protein
MGGRKTLFIMNFGRLARDKNIKCIFFGTYKTVVKMNKACFLLLRLKQIYKQNIKIAIKGTNIVIVHACFHEEEEEEEALFFHKSHNTQLTKPL